VLVGLSAGSWVLLYVPAAFVLLLFPDGRLPGPRWRGVAVGLLVVPVAFAALGMFDPDGFDAPYQAVPLPFGPAPDWLVPVAFALLPVFMALLVAAAAAMIVRYRRATDAVLRAQLRWFALAAAFLPLTLLLCWTSYVLLGEADLVVIGLALTLLALPTATAIALLRHDLYDVDRAVSAAVTYGLVSTALLAVFTTVTVVAGALLGRDSAVVAGHRDRSLGRRAGPAAHPAAAAGGRPALPAAAGRPRGAGPAARPHRRRPRPPEDLEDTCAAHCATPACGWATCCRAGPAWSTWPRRRCRSATGGGCRCTSATPRSGCSCRCAPTRPASCCGRSRRTSG
jgi:hypothetical protein